MSAKKRSKRGGRADDERDDEPRIDAPDDRKPLVDEEYYEEIVILDLRPIELRDRW